MRLLNALEVGHHPVLKPPGYEGFTALTLNRGIGLVMLVGGRRCLGDGEEGAGRVGEDC
jgi:hypothetical protein